MNRFFASMGQKPRHLQNLYAFGIAFVITALIAGIWATTLPARFAPPSASEGASRDGFEKSGALLQESLRRFAGFAGAIAHRQERGSAASSTGSSSVRFIDLDTLATSTPNKEEKVILIGTSSAERPR